MQGDWIMTLVALGDIDVGVLVEMPVYCCPFHPESVDLSIGGERFAPGADKFVLLIQDGNVVQFKG